MLPEQQQRILGYFIEEAKDHLNTIEQGLLNLQSTLEDPEMVNEVFRAAHSIKGGAAMLGLSSIQRTSHRLEDFFKLLKEHPIRVDQKLESLFLGVLDTLKALLEHLQGPFGLTNETANTLMSETEPVFGWLHEHLELLVQQSQPDSAIKTTKLQVSSSTPQRAISVEQLQAQVLQSLREMLQMFKQQATPETRQSLQNCCQNLAQLGDGSGWSQWCDVCRTASGAIANPDNTYLTLAKIVITEIKQALELVVSDRETEIVVSEQLRSLVGVQEEIEFIEIPLDLFDEVADTSTASSDISDEISEPAVSTSAFDLTDTDKENSQEADDSIEYMELEPEDSISSLSDLNSQFCAHFDHPPHHSSTPDTHGPEVGIAELNTLADLFESESPELGDTWDKEEILDLPSDSQEIDLSTINTDDTDSDFEFLFDEETTHQKREIKPSSEELTLVQLFGNAFAEEEKIETRNQEKTGLSIEFTSNNTEQLSSEKASQQLTGASEKVEAEVSSLLDLELDKNQSKPLDNDTPITSGVIPEIELSTHQNVSFDELFLETPNLFSKVENSLENLVAAEEPETLLPQSESLALEELFTSTEQETKPVVRENKLISGDVFDTLPTLDELSHFFWEPQIQEPENIELDSLIDKEAAKELEEILFAATTADDFFGDRHPSLSGTSESLSLEELDFNLPPDKQQFNIFSSEADDDLFEELIATEPTIPSPAHKGEVSPKEIRNYTQKPEALELTPEFASPTETSQIPSAEFASPTETSQIPSAEFDIELFEVDNDEIFSFEFELTPTTLLNDSTDNADNRFVLPQRDIVDNSDSPENAQAIVLNETSQSLDVDIYSQTIDIEAQTISQEDFDFTDLSDTVSYLPVVETEESQIASEDATFLTVNKTDEVAVATGEETLPEPKSGDDLSELLEEIEIENDTFVYKTNNEREESTQEETSLVQSNDLPE
ncbi:MAG: Hpt domain-containing protein, partial [Scytonema sp. PMC 1069.18]|nr:Hpt domain-containing protein [Scytonema sp. PMC 1069.18]